MNANILIYTLFLSFLVTQVSYAQRTFATDPEREIIVQFTDEVLTHKNEGVSGRFSDYTFTSNLIKHNLDSVGIETISTLFPEFKKEDRLVETRNGKQVTLSDWSNTMILHLPANRSREKFIELLNQLPEVVYAEANVQGSSEVIYDFRDEYDSGSEAEAFMPVTPNDPNFNRQWALKNTGTSIQGSGTPDADIDADLAWDITTGSSSIKIAIIDQGVQNSHPEFNGKITGYPTFYSNHGTMVAGIAAAYGNNSAGITGVAYSASIIDEWTGYQSASDLASAVTNASQQGAHVLNASWGIDDYSVTLRKAIRDAYLLNQVFITSAGNSEGHKYPQHIRDGMITVSGTTNNDGKFSNSSTGSWVDVAAPAGEFSEQNDRIYSTLPGGNYGYSGAGTSYAAPHVSGIAALLLSENPNLYNDDIENLIEISAEDINNNGFDNTFGHGRVNAYEALKLLQSPYVLNYGSTTGGSFYSQSGGFPMRTYDVSGLSSGLQYYVKRVEVRKNISFSYLDEPNVWCRGVESVGWTKEEDHGGAKRNYGQGFCEVVPGTLTNTSATLRTYIYNVWNYSAFGGQGSYKGKYPTNETNVEFNYTIHGIPGTPPPPSPSLSGSVSNGMPYLSWNSVSSATSYKINRVSYNSSVSNATFTTTNTSYTDGSLPFNVEVDYGILDNIGYTVQAVNSSGESAPSNMVLYGEQGGGWFGKIAEVLPQSFSLQHNYPNPFNPSTQIEYALPEESEVTIRVFNIMGQQVATVVSQRMPAGFHEATFEAGNLSSGVYIARLEAVGESGQQFTKELKMQLIK